jgi:hypothetical protein
VIAVFVGDQDGPCDDPYVRAMRTHMLTGTPRGCPDQDLEAVGDGGEQ